MVGPTRSRHHGDMTRDPYRIVSLVVVIIGLAALFGTLAVFASGCWLRLG